MDGVFLFNKPIHWTSHDAVDFARRKFGQKAVGHAGTLDPMATGLLILLAGSATKRSAEFMGFDKEYEGTFSLGVRTDTQDLEGRIVDERDAAGVTRERVEQVFAEFIGPQKQTPPQFSAVKLKGKKLYQDARKGLVTAVEPRDVVVNEFEVTHFFQNEIAFRLACSKGTYVRALCDAVGERLGCGAVLSSLVRTRIGPYRLKNAGKHEDLSRV